mgnify:CR=1 FL=1
MKKSQLKSLIKELIKEAIIELKYSKKKDYLISIDNSEIKKIKGSVVEFRKLLNAFTAENNKEKYPVFMNEHPYHTEIVNISNKISTPPNPWDIVQINTNPAFNNKNKKFNIIIQIERTDPKYFKAMGNYGGLD